MSSQKYTNPFPAPKRFITTHDASGKAIIDARYGEEMPITVIKGGEVDFGLGFTTSSFPVSFADDADLSAYGGHLKTGPGIAVPTGTVMRVVTMAPGHVSPMHRTSSLDYGVVLEGACELVLDSGETRLMKRGDTSVQRGTNHAWRNASDKEWCRMLYVVIGAEAAVVNGKKLEEDTNGAEQGQTGDLQK
ncbi:hypothetical protein BDZ85DRAFT_270693 [Elsinoe ampelina]|uniref:Cupin type-2 domain-containing protein n=1 Tax=Elsinoe ampelina TaxID=302913 RepID=A0A6A6FXX3_9PEZI|nr:hypothetical protein BDZ85DRAFT_270693 [Elsinoe ampelina]